MNVIDNNKYIKNVVTELSDVVHTQISMIQDRNYILDSTDTQILKLNKKQFIEYYLDFFTTNKNKNIYHYFSKTYTTNIPNKRDIFVYYQNSLETPGTAVNTENIKTFVTIREKLEEENKKKYDVVFISKQKIGPPAFKEFSNRIVTGKSSFTYKQLVYNPVNHKLNSEFYILSDTEKIKFLRDNGILDETKMPSIFHNDRMVLHYGAKIGNVIKITRNNIFFPSVIKKTITYRLVVQHANLIKNKNIDLSEGSDTKEEIEEEIDETEEDIQDIQEEEI